MEAVGLASSIIAITQIAERVATVCKSYIDGVADYPKDLRAICIETESLATVLRGLRWLDKEDAEDAHIISQLEGPVEQCKAAIKSLTELLPDPAATPTSTKGAKRRKLHSALDALAWPLKAERARKLLDELMQFKSTISMAIGGSLLKDVQAIKKTLSESQVRDLCQWFEHTDPSPRHNAAKVLYENETLTWILRCEEWINWVSLRTRCVWIYGIPGAGKTVLAAYLIEQVRLACESVRGPGSDYVYYYCYHGHSQDEAAPLLRWLIGQLCRRSQTVPEQAYKIHQLNQQPDLQGLLEILAAVLQSSGSVFVVIDALDESQPRSNLLKVIEDLVLDERFRKVHLLVTSRQELDIERTMSKISHSISMSNPLVENDIKLYVRSQVLAEPRFQCWPPDLKDEVEVSLANGAKGMFRWAVCQLDILRRLKRIDRIKASLQDLPQGLDESYERIFSLIDTEDRELVRHTLHWLCFHIIVWEDAAVQDPTVSILLDSYSFSTGVDLRLINADTLRESCGCLLSYNDTSFDGGSQTQVALAHYTVREFLESHRAKGPTSSFFIIREEESYANVCETIFTHALRPNHSNIKDTNDPNFGITLDEYCQNGTLGSFKAPLRLLMYQSNKNRNQPQPS
ncbi:hypothetical protein QQX98_007070 [Neonectria punicea]|uniref:NACHT domain-containing protein n=1 Tax=Neonectria punicea TaxID=979145 RepID=A0ABR1GYZ0_9HYPO